jgi:ATP-dependent Clp protease adaptor protein ClpS
MGGMALPQVAPVETPEIKEVQKLFGYSKDHAEKLMLDVHNEGKAVVTTGAREKMEMDASSLHGYGLWATVDRA